MPLPTEVLDALVAPIRQCPVKIEWLDWNENVTGEYTAYAISGSVRFDASNEVRRSFTLILENSEGLFIPNGSLTNLGVKLRLKRGIVVNGVTYWWSRGVYVLTDPSCLNEGSRKEVTLNGVSKWALFNGDLGGVLTETYTIPSGTNVAQAIKAILQLKNETKFNFENCTLATPYTITKEPGNTLADLLRDLALIPSWELFDTIDGYWRFRPMVDASQKAVVIDLTIRG